jgi:hypothetical protein
MKFILLANSVVKLRFEIQAILNDVQCVIQQENIV